MMSNRPCLTDIAVRDGIFDSDRKEVSCLVTCVKTAVTLTSKHTAFNYKESDFQQFRTALEPLPWNALDGMHLDAAVDTFYDLNAAMNDCIPVVEIRINYPSWFDRDLHAWLSDKDTAFKRMKRNRCVETEEAFRDRRRKFRNAANQKYSAYLIGLTDDFKSNPKRFWSFLKSAKDGNRGLPALMVDGVEISDDRDKANVLNKAFASKFTDGAVTVFPDCPSYDLPSLSHFECSLRVGRSRRKSEMFWFSHLFPCF